MGQKCIIKSCTNASYKKENSELMFHRFPTNAIYRESWIINIQVLANQIGRISDNAVICSDHFEKDAYTVKSDGKKCLSRTAETTLFRVETQSHSDSFVNIEKLSNSSEYTRMPFSVRDWQLNNSSSGLSRSPAGDCGLKNKSSRVSGPDNTTSSVSENVNPGSKVNRLRYPGDIHDMARMSRQQLENCVRICKRKVEEKSTTIKSLRRQIRPKDDRISTLRCLVKEIKKKYALSEHAATSIEEFIRSVMFCQ